MEAAKILQSIPCSSLWEIANKAIILSEQGHDVIRLELGRPDFDTPEHIKAAAKKALDEGHVHYVSHYGIFPLRQAIAKIWEQNTNHTIDPNKNILITAGGTEALYLSYAAFLNPGDEILISDPGWVTYFHAPKLVGANIVSYPLIKDGRFGLHFDEIQKRITPKTRMILINTPSNPVGGVFSLAELKKLADLAKERNIIIVSDEVYHTQLFNNNKHYSIASFENMFEQVITIDSFSKTYSMTGWRLGYVIASHENIEIMLRVHQQLGATCCSFGQYGALAALTESQKCVSEMCNIYENRVKLVTNHLDKMDKLSYIQPQGGLYIYINVEKTGLTGEQFALKLLDQEKVAIMPGIAFGPSGNYYVRLCIASSEQMLEKAMCRIGNFIKNL